MAYLSISALARRAADAVSRRDGTFHDYYIVGVFSCISEYEMSGQGQDLL